MSRRSETRARSAVVADLGPDSLEQHRQPRPDSGPRVDLADHDSASGGKRGRGALEHAILQLQGK